MPSISVTTVAVVTAVAAVASAGVAAYGQMQQAEAQSQAANAKAQQDRNNAILAGRSADDAQARGLVSEQQKATQTAQAIGAQRTSQAANGVDPNSGSAVDLQSDTAGSGELDQLTIVSNSEREAAGYRAQGMNYSTQANIDEAASQNALTAGELGATSSLIGGAGKVAGQWYSYNYGTRAPGAGYGGGVY